MSRGEGLLLVNTNREIRPTAVLPIGLLRVADACEAAGIDVRVLDLAFVRRPQAKLAKALRQRPALVGFGVRNLDNPDVQAPLYYLPFVRSLVEVVEAAGDIPTVVGGAGVSMAPELVRAELGVDCVVSGPGEATAIELFRRAEAGEPLPETADGTPTVFAPSARFERWINLAPYRRRGAPLSVQSRRGCPFKCIYCNYSKIEGAAGYELGQIEGIVEAVRERIAATGMTDVEFVDSTFNSPAGFARKLCDALAEADLGASFVASGVTPRFSDRETLEAMKRAGFCAIWCTPDTASPTTIEAWAKDFSMENLSGMARWTSELQLPVMWSFMFGGPAETEATVKETLSFIEEAIDPDHPVMLTARMRIYPSTRLAEVAVEQGYPEPVLDLNAPRQFYLSPELEPEQLDELLRDARKRMPNIMFMEGSQAKSLPWLQRVHSFFGNKEPLWVSYPKSRKRMQKIGLD